jgi:hypothetical protein
MVSEDSIRSKFLALSDVLNERARRLWAAAEVREAGYGGFNAVIRATGISRNALARGLRELDSGKTFASDRIRRRGGGRKAADVLDAGLRGALGKLIDPLTRGDPESPLRWTCKGTRRLAAELKRQKYVVSHTLVARLLREMGYSLQANSKSHEGIDHPDRDAQFQYINGKIARHMQRMQPAISVDTKKKELVGDFKNGGQEWEPQGRPEKVRVHDFVDKELGKAIPYGVYDLARNVGWVSVGVTHDTAAFAAATIRNWWRRMGKAAYPNAQSLLITADSGGSNGKRVRLWKWELQKFADESGLRIQVCHLPPGTSKWNKIEHRLFSFISQNWRGRPLLTHATIVNLIAGTRTQGGLKVKCELDRRKYAKGVKVTREQMRSINLTPDTFHGDWNYVIATKV